MNVLWLEKAAAADKPYSLEGRTDLSVCSTAGTRTPTADSQRNKQEAPSDSQEVKKLQFQMQRNIHG